MATYLFFSSVLYDEPAENNHFPDNSQHWHSINLCFQKYLGISSLGHRILGRRYRERPLGKRSRGSADGLGGPVWIF
jgi:hypothetical protein